MNRQHHLICRRGVIESFILVRQPNEFRFPVALADVSAELDETGVDRIVHRVRVEVVAGALDGDSSLVILPAGRTPAAVLFLDTKRHSAILADAVVAACLTARIDEAPTDAFRTQPTNDTVGCDAVDAVGPLPGMVRAEFRVCHKWAVRTVNKKNVQSSTVGVQRCSESVHFPKIIFSLLSRSGRIFSSSLANPRIPTFL